MYGIASRTCRNGPGRLSAKIHFWYRAMGTLILITNEVPRSTPIKGRAVTGASCWIVACVMLPGVKPPGIVIFYKEY